MSTFNPRTRKTKPLYWRARRFLRVSKHRTKSNIVLCMTIISLDIVNCTLYKIVSLNGSPLKSVSNVHTTSI